MNLLLICFIGIVSFSVFLSIKRELGLLLPGTVVPLLLFLAYGIEPLYSKLGLPIPYPIEASVYSIKTLLYVVLFTGLLTLSLWLSYYYLSTRLPKPEKPEIIPVFSTFFLVLITLLIFISSIFLRGGISVLWEDPTIRGEGQWTWTWPKYLLLAFDILAPLIVILSAYNYGKTSERILWIVPVLFSIPRLATFSRGAFLYLLIFVFTSMLSGKKFTRKVMAFSIGLTIIGMLTGIVGRSTFHPGLKNALLNLFSLDIFQSQDMLLKSFVLGTSRFRALLQVISIKPSQDYLNGMLSWGKILLPIPTFLGWYDYTALNLAEFGGVYGNPFPALGDMYYFLGNGALFIALILGLFFGYLQTKISQMLKVQGWVDLAYLLIYMASIQGLLTSFNNTSRAGTRYVLYAFILVLLLKIIHPYRQIKLSSCSVNLQNDQVMR